MTHWAYNLYVSALTRPVRYRSRTGLETATVGVDERVDPSAALPPQL